MSSDLIKGKFQCRDIQREEDMKTHEECHPQATERSSYQKLGDRQRTGFPSQPSEGTNPAKTPCLWTSGLQIGETINFYFLSHSVCGTLLWQPKETNTYAKVKNMDFPQVKRSH